MVLMTRVGWWMDGGDTVGRGVQMVWCRFSDNLDGWKGVGVRLGKGRGV